MNITSCLHPLRVYNKYIDEYIWVPCRKCAACRNAKQADLVSRLQYESMQWPTVIFFTLTYSDDYCPSYYLFNSGDDVVFTKYRYMSEFDRDGHFLEEYYNEDGELYEFGRLSEFGDEVLNDDKSIEFIERALRTDSLFRVVDKSHVQNFIKRLRNFFYKNYNNEKLRYFIVSEYGCSDTENFRPHYHGLLFTDSKQFRKEFYKVLCSCWKHGFVGADVPYSNAAGYVAKYVNSLTTYPKIFETLLARPFALFSRNPAIGVLKDTDPEVKKIVVDRVNSLYLYDKTSVKSVPFFRSFESRYFPKCREFDKISHYDRVEQYKAIARPKYYSEGYIKEMNSLLSPEMQRDDAVSRRVNYLCDVFNLSLDEYVKRIEDYYSVKKLLNLSKFYEFQESVIAKGGDVNQLVNCYPEMVKQFYDWYHDKVLPNSSFLRLGIMTDDVRKLFNHFKPYFKFNESDYLDLDLSKFDLDNSDEYQRFKSESFKRSRDSQKTKKLNSKKIKL